MAAVSQFSTAENFKKLQDALTKVDQGIAEAELAAQAGIPGAAEDLAAAKQLKDRISQVFNTYFPTGTAPVG